MKPVFLQCECSYYCVLNTRAGALEMVPMIMNRKNDSFNVKLHSVTVC